MTAPELRENDLQPGAVLAETYEIVRAVARGGMGMVYEARHRRLAGKRVAVKVLRRDANLSPREVALRFRREAEICASLSHPHIITVTDWGTLPDEVPYFVMEYLDGVPLDRRMAVGRLPLPLIGRIIEQVASALQYAHDQTIVHRDLKPSNVFLLPTAVDDAEPSYVKVLDFGISKVLSGVTLETTETKLIGSPRYMSPEQARGDNEAVTPAADQFALATVAYEMVAGRPAFTGDTLSSVLFNIVYEPPPPLLELAPDAPAELVDVIAKGMAKDPGERFESVLELSRAVAEALGDGLADTVTVDRRFIRRRGPGHVVGAVLLAAGAAALGVGLWWASSMRGADGDAAAPATDSGVPALAGATPPPDEGTDPTTTGDHAPATAAPDAQGQTPVASPAAKTGRDRRPPPVPPPPESVRPALAEADSALARGEYELAIRVAERTIGVADTPQARRIIALGYCQARNLEMANASVRRVAVGDLALVRQVCRAHGLNLEH